MFFSKKTNGFYSEEIHGNNMPDDVVEITAEQHIELLEKQAEGHKITADENGFPIAVAVPKYQPTYADLRRHAYPPMVDYIDAVVKADQAAIDAYIEKCREVKRMYPKE